MLKRLEEIFTEDKFQPGANDWEGYTGCKDLKERKAYSQNIDNCIGELKKLISNSVDQNSLLAVVSKYERIASWELEEQYKADTDESEIRWMYFDRIRRIISQGK